MSIIKRLVEKYGRDEKKVKGDDRAVLDLLKSFVPGPSDGDETDLSDVGLAVFEMYPDSSPWNEQQPDEVFSVSESAVLHAGAGKQSHDRPFIEPLLQAALDAGGERLSVDRLKCHLFLRSNFCNVVLFGVPASLNDSPGGRSLIVVIVAKQTQRTATLFQPPDFSHVVGVRLFELLRGRLISRFVGAEDDSTVVQSMNGVFRFPPALCQRDFYLTILFGCQSD
jgi:hypothetical protein